MQQTVGSDLCTSCGLCCDGTLFPAVFLEKEKRHLFTIVEGDRFPQRCEHLSDCNTCAIYKDRPTACQAYRCGVLKAVEGGKLSFDKAQEIINKVKEEVKRLQGAPNTKIIKDFEKYGKEPPPSPYGDDFIPGMPFKIN